MIIYKKTKTLFSLSGNRHLSLSLSVFVMLLSAFSCLLDADS